jgi:hypothetical protein
LPSPFTLPPHIPHESLLFILVFHFLNVYFPCLKGFHHGVSPMNILYFNQINPSYYFLTLTPYPLPPINQQLSGCFIIAT